MHRYESLPSQFYLQDLAAITGRVCELRVNPHQAEADRMARAWFNKCVSLTVYGRYANKGIQMQCVRG